MEKSMTRVKEVKPGSDEIPDYKSDPARLVHSLRKGYNNLREKLEISRKRIKYYQIKVRDLEKSRDDWKNEFQTLKASSSYVKNENSKLKKQVVTLEEGLDEKKKHL